MNTIKLLRLLNNRTQKDLADLLHVSRSCYCQYELGTRRPDLSILLCLSGIYSVPVKVLLKETFDASVFSMYLSLSEEDCLTIDNLIKEKYSRS